MYCTNLPPLCLVIALVLVKRLEFQAYRLTGAGLLKLTALPQLEVGLGSTAAACLQP
jgi:hypothetical protein